jgi:hypothetical protein
MYRKASPCPSPPSRQAKWHRDTSMRICPATRSFPDRGRRSHGGREGRCLTRRDAVGLMVAPFFFGQILITKIVENGGLGLFCCIYDLIIQKNIQKIKWKFVGWEGSPACADRCNQAENPLSQLANFPL